MSLKSLFKAGKQKTLRVGKKTRRKVTRDYASHRKYRAGTLRSAKKQGRRAFKKLVLL